jgi:hypothetical protein
MGPVSNNTADVPREGRSPPDADSPKGSPPVDLSTFGRIKAWLGKPSGITFLVVASFMALGGYLRLHDLGVPSLWSDEAQSTIYAFSVLKHGYPVIVAPHLINNWEPLYPYFEAASILVLGASNFAFRLPSALFGIALIPIAYWVGSGLRDRYVGITLAAMTAFSTEYIAWSRQARWYILLVVLLALGLLVALAWYNARQRRQRVVCAVSLVTLAILAAFASLGLFLLYLPAILVAGLVYLALSRWETVRRFFGRPSPPSTLSDLPPARLIPYRARLWTVVGLAVALTVLCFLFEKGLVDVYTVVFSRLVGFPPYSLAWSYTYGPYLIQYYPGVVALAAVGAVFILLRKNPLEISLVALCGAGFVTVSTLSSLTNGPATLMLPGGPTPHAAYERHVVPLLFFLFIPAAIAIVELFQRSYRAIAPHLRSLPHSRGATPAIFGVIVVVLLVVPGIIVPSTTETYRGIHASPAGSLVAWFPFSVDPAFPSALYSTEQPNFNLVSSYILTHRNASDVIAATSPGPPTIYCGSVQYWVISHPPPTVISRVGGRPAYYLTGSLLVDNTSQLEGLLLNSSGWFINAETSPSPLYFPNGMNLVPTEFMTKVAAASDVSISLYRWNLSTPLTLIQMLQAREPSLGNLGSNVTVLADWATTTGVIGSNLRDLLLPLEASLLAYVAPSYRPLAVLDNVYNHRPDLQAAFPQILTQHPTNYTALIQWAYRVATGAIVDSAQPVLAPYASWYKSHG